MLCPFNGHNLCMYRHKTEEKSISTANTNGINQAYATVCAHIILYNMLCHLNAKSRSDIIIKKLQQRTYTRRK